MGGDDSQKLLPWRGPFPLRGHETPAYANLNTLTQAPTGVTSIPKTTTGYVSAGASQRG